MPDKLYRVDVRVYATMYIKAGSVAEARTIAQKSKNLVIEIPPGDYGEIEISNRRFNDPELPKVSFSGAMTVHGVDDSTRVERVE